MVSPAIGLEDADAINVARQNQVLLLHHIASDTDIELSLAWLPFEHEALAHYKAVARRERNRIDIERLIELHAERSISSGSKEFSTSSRKPSRNLNACANFNTLLKRMRIRR